MQKNSMGGERVPPFKLQEPVSILMPVCNEVDVIDEVINEWCEQVIRFLPEGSELVLDDCSNDGTEKRLQALMQQHPFIRVNFSKRDGFFNSAMRLYRLSRCPLVFFTDSDGQYVPSEFWKIAVDIGHYDMVHGAKVNRKDPLFRIQASFVFNQLIRRWFKSSCLDVNSAFRLIRRAVLTAVLNEIHCLSMLPNAELYLRAEAKGFKIKNVPVRHRVRKFAKSRSLPFKTFGQECWRAFCGAYALRKEIVRPV
jgi:glycosyltransferase involved in cell wall biosynthesis